MLPFVLATSAVLAVWAMYKVIVYALPCLLGLGAASLAISTGADLVGASLVGPAVAVSSFYLLRFLVANLHSGLPRLAMAAAFAGPSAVLAYNIGIDALAGSVPTEFWRQALSIVFALVAGTMGFARLTERKARLP